MLPPSFSLAPLYSGKIIEELGSTLIAHGVG